MIIDDLNELKFKLQSKKLKLEQLMSDLFALKEELAESRKDYDNLYNFNSSAYLTINKNYIIEAVNFQGAILLGVDRKQLHHKLFLNFITTNSQDTFINTIKKVDRTLCKQTCEVELLPKGGSKRSVVLESTMIRGNQIFLCLSDITDSYTDMSHLTELKWSLNRTNHLFQYTKDAIAALDVKLYIVALNKSFSELFSLVFSIKIDVGMSLIAALTDFPVLKAKIISACQEALSGNKTYVIIENHRNKNEIYYHYEICINSLLNPTYQKNELSVQIRNLTEHKLQERQQLKQQADIAQSMRTTEMGEMTSALAHEINQPLTAIIAYSHSCLFILNNKLDKHKTGVELIAPLEQIALQAEHAGEIIHSIKNLMSRGSLNPEETDINGLIKETLSILNYEILDLKLKITLNLSDNIPLIMTHKIHIMQVILNLTQNSIEALHTVFADNPELHIETRKSGNYIHVHIRDNGPGIDNELKSEVLKPYFTTKPQGTGLGLGICKTLIENHQGQLIIKEHDGKGAWFTFTLPINFINQHHDI